MDICSESLKIKTPDKDVDGYDEESLDEVSIASYVLVRKMDHSTRLVEQLHEIPVIQDSS